MAENQTKPDDLACHNGDLTPQSQSAEILARAAELAGLIKESRLYGEFTEAKAWLDASPEYAGMVKDYMALRASGYAEQGGLEQRVAESSAYFKLAAVDGVRRYMEAAKALTDLSCEVIDIVAEVCPADLPE